MGIMFESIRLEESMNRVQHNQTMVWDDDDDGVNRTKEWMEKWGLHLHLNYLA